MKKLIHVLVIICLCQLSNAQQIFTDSGQRLGNSFSWDVKLGDLDDDGDLDAVVGNSWDVNQKNEIWLNNGDAAFTKSQQSLGSSSIVSLFDINTDGHLDIIEHGWQDNSMKVWINDGKANYTKSENFPLKGNLICFDNKLDSTNKHKAVTLERNDNTLLRFFSININGIQQSDSLIINNFQGGALVVGDLNNDGYSDIVLGNGNTKPGPSIIFFNDTKGGFTRSNQQLGNYIVNNIYLGNLNADGFLDILLCNYHNPEAPYEIYPVQLYLNNGSGNFTWMSLPYSSSYITPSAAILDLDNDGDLDIYMNHGHQHFGTTHKSEILFNDGHANFTTTTVNLEKINSITTAFGDLDKDGDLDIFLACGDLFSIGQPNRVWLNSTITNPTSIKERKKENNPTGYKLFQNYPNPFNPSTTINYQLSASSNVKLKIFDLLGREIKTLINSFENAGEYSLMWDATDNGNNLVSSGIYFYSLVTDDMNLQKKMILIR